MKSAHADQKYIEALLNNDTVLIKEVYQKLGPEVRNFVLKNSGSLQDAKDIFQETIAGILLNVRKEKFTLTVPFGGYAYRIYRNKWIDELKKRGRKKVTINDLERYKNNIDPFIETFERDFSEIRFDILSECLKKLSDRYQNIIKAYYYDKLKGEEIKNKFKFPSVGAVRKAMYDCRENLKKCMLQHPDFSN